MNNCRSGKHAPYIREWEVHITRHLEKFLHVFASWHLKSIHTHPRKDGVLRMFIKSVRDLMQVYDLQSLVGVRSLPPSRSNHKNPPSHMPHNLCLFRFMITFNSWMLSWTYNSQNAWLNSTTIFSYAPYFGNAWGFYPTHFPYIGWHPLKWHQFPFQWKGSKEPWNAWVDCYQNWSHKMLNSLDQVID
jgi:hypothetical protein